MQEELVQKAAGTLPAQHAVAPKRPRGQERQQALIEAGLQLTASRRWSEVTVSDIAQAIGCSVGTFYTRFHNKEAYFAVLQQLLAEVLQQRLDAFHAAPEREGETPAQFLQAWVGLMVHSFRLHRGLYAAALGQTQQQPRDANTAHPLAKLRLVTRGRLVAAMARWPQWQGEVAAARLGFAHQMLHGLLVSAVLTDPGPVRLDEAALVAQTAEVLGAYLGIAPDHRDNQP